MKTSNEILFIICSAYSLLVEGSIPGLSPHTSLSTPPSCSSSTTLSIPHSIASTHPPHLTSPLSPSISLITLYTSR